MRILDFSPSLTLIFTYSDEALTGLNPMGLSIEQQHENEPWKRVPDCMNTLEPVQDDCISSFDPGARTVTLVTNHLDAYQLMAPPAPPPASPIDQPETGSTPPSEASGSPYMWPAAVLAGGLLLTAGGLITLRTRIRRS